MIPIDRAPPVVITPLKAGGVHHILGGQLLTAKGYPVRHVQSVPFAEAWTGDHRDDDLFACMYGTLRPEGRLLGHQGLTTGNVCRLTKGAPALLASSIPGVQKTDFVMTQKVIDIDIKDMIAVAEGSVPGQKIAWSDELRAQFRDEIWPAAREKLKLPDPTLFYTTRNGMRFVYVLRHPIPIHGVGGGFDRYRGLLLDLILAGIPVDTQTKDWTRLQRLPKVRREIPDPADPDRIIGYEHTGEQSYFRQSWGRLDIDVVEEEPPAEIATYWPEAFPGLAGRDDLSDYKGHPQYENLRKIWLGAGSTDLVGERQEHVECGMRPTDDEAEALVHRPAANGRAPLTQAAKNIAKAIAKKAAMGTNNPAISSAATNLHRVLFEDADLDTLDPGNLHGAMMRGISDLCWLLNDQLRGSVTPQLVYALHLGPAIRQNDLRVDDPSLGKARGDAEIREELWNLVLHVYPREVNRFRQMEEDAEEAKREANATDTRTSQLIMDYFIARGFPMEEVQSQWRQMLVLKVDLGYLILTIRRGNVITWMGPYSNETEAYAAVQPGKCGHDHIKSWDVDKDMRVVWIELFSRYGTSSPAPTRCSRVIKYHDVEPFIEAGVTHPRFVLRLPGIAEDVDATFHEDVDAWLRAYGETNPEQFLDQLATYPDLRKPWPAIYKCGYADEGKNLLTAALRRLNATGSVADFTDALGGFQDDFKDTILLTIDEGSSTEHGPFKKQLNEVLRRIIGGDDIKISQKGIKGLRVEGCVRTVISANHEEALDWGTNLTASDVEAIRKRVAFYGPSQKARNILLRAGGRFGNQYGPGTETTNWPERVAEHIMWLHENREVKSSGRFAIDVIEDDWHGRQRAKGTGQLTICRGIVKMLMAKGDLNEEAIRVVPSELDLAKNGNKTQRGVYVSPEAFYDQMQVTFAYDRQIRIPTLETCSKIIRDLYKTDENGKPLKVQYRVNKKRVRGGILDIDQVLKILQSHGLNCDLQEELGDEIWWNDVSSSLRADVEGIDDGPIPFPGPPPPVERRMV